MRKLFCLAFIFSFLASIFFNRGNFSFIFLVQEWGNSPDWQNLLFSVRLPRVVLACLCGSAFAGAGVLTQGVFRNPLACPSVLGITSASALSMIVLLWCIGQGFSWAYPGVSLASCFVMTGVLLLFFQQTTLKLLLCGFALTYFFSSLTSLFLSLLLKDSYQAMSAMQWILGGLTGKNWNHVGLCFVFWTGGLVLTWFVLPKLDVLTLGEDIAQSLGVNLTRTRGLAVLGICFFLSGALSTAGPIPFLGLLIPHLTRTWMGVQHRPLFFWSLLNGATLTVVADYCARNVFFPQDLEVGVLTAILGAPFYLKQLMSLQHHVLER